MIFLLLAEAKHVVFNLGISSINVQLHLLTSTASFHTQMDTLN